MVFLLAPIPVVLQKSLILSLCGFILVVESEFLLGVLYPPSFSDSIYWLSRSATWNEESIRLLSETVYSSSASDVYKAFWSYAFIGENNLRVIDLDNHIVSKPKNRDEALEILERLNGKKHYLISSVSIAKNGSMVWNYTEKAELTMKSFSVDELKIYLSKIPDEKLYAYNVYQIEGEGKSLFNKIEGNENTIMGLPIDKIKEYLEKHA